MKEQTTEIAALLLTWYAAHKRELPWRGAGNPYYVWLSEVILQQTRVAQGLPYYQRFVEQFPTVEALAQAPEAQVLKVWQGLGYYSRAKNLQRAAQYITEELQGVFPSTYETLLKLKGVGEYTASAIASICYNEPKAVVDGNVYRVLSRIFDIDTPINTTEGAKYFKELAQELLDKERAGEYNQAIMDFGALQCKPKSPDCESCILSAKCLAYHRKKVTQRPVKIAKIKPIHRYFHYCVLKDSQGNTQLHKREAKDIWQGLYEFPLIEVKENTTEAQVIETIRAQYPHTTYIKKYATEFLHKLTHQHLHTCFWEVEVAEVLSDGLSIRELVHYPMPALLIKFLKKEKI